MGIKGRKGIAFILALALVLAIALGTGAFMLLSSNEIRMVRTQGDSTRAFYVAEAGIEKCVAWLRSQSSPPTSVYGPLTEPLAATNYTGSFTITITSDAANPIPPAVGIYRYIIESTGTVDNVTRTVNVEEKIELNTFARYSYFTSHESYMVWWWWWQLEVPVWFTTGTFLEGPVHTNDQFHISGNPIFDGPVSSVAATIDYMHGGPPNDNPEFRQGITLGADAVDTVPLTANNLEAAAAEDGGYTFNGTTTVVLISDGTVDVTNRSFTPRTQNMPLPANGALFVTNGDLDISGTLDGRLTAGSSRDVVIKDDIRYADDPRINPGSNDALAIISNRDVVVDEHAANGNPGKNLEIFATVIAIGQEPTYGNDDGSFYVENYWSGLRGVLTVYGGLIQKRRGPVGTFYSSTNQKASGYDKDYHYDTRMSSNPPPHIPCFVTYGRLSWQETEE